MKVLPNFIKCVCWPEIYRHGQTRRIQAGCRNKLCFKKKTCWICPSL